MRPLSDDSVTLAPSVAGSATAGTAAPARWRAAPSSTGAGIFDQSTLSKFLSVIAAIVRSSSASRAQQAAFFAVPVALALGLALVVQLLAFGQRQLDFRPALLVEIELQRHQRHAF